MLSLLLSVSICQAGLILLLCRSSRADLFLENLALRHQLGVLKRSIKRPKIKAIDRLFWVLLSRLWRNWQNALAIFQPRTIVRWHKLGFKIFWRWKSRKKLGRPVADLELRQLIRQISSENPLKKAGQIRDIIKSLGYEPPDLKTIRKYMVKSLDPNRRSSTWRTFLKNHLDCSWAIDFFTVQTMTFKILYVFVVFDHGRRKVIHFASAFHPTLQWVIQQIREATPFGRQPKYLFHDNDGIYGLGLDYFLRRCGIKPVRTAYRSPWQNPFVERFIGTVRRELLDHMIVLSQRHLNRLLAEFIDDYYHVGRPHQGLGGQTPIYQGVAQRSLIPQPRAPTGPSRIVSVPVLGGLHHRYYRAVA